MSRLRFHAQPRIASEAPRGSEPRMDVQLDLLSDPLGPEIVTVHVPGVGRVLQTPGGGWRARYTGCRWGWVFYRAIGPEWESVEPDLPFGVDHVERRDEAVRVLEGFTERHGDNPAWLLEALGAA